jgi:predicted negative regulator of RcsB-dependent stress response
MASQLDLEEQEQIDQLKHFWKRYGNAITWLLIAVLGAFAAFNGWQYWQRKQASEAAVMYDQIEAAVQAGDMTRLDRALADIKERYAGTTYAHQSALLAARTYYDKGKADQAKAALAWVVEKAGDEGLQAVARLRLAGIALEAKAYDEALAQLGAKMPAEFAALADDRRGDVYLAQGKKPQALAEYRKAYAAMDERAEYRALVEVKLNALGVDVSPGVVAEAKK